MKQHEMETRIDCANSQPSKMYKHPKNKDSLSSSRINFKVKKICILERQITLCENLLSNIIHTTTGFTA